MLGRPEQLQPRPRAIAVWLLVIAALVFVMIVVGGITRLTESGLSMVRWEPISGVVPPLDQQQWDAEFAAYKAYPEYQQNNRGMSLGEFKEIFFWEYLHRLLGRLLGVAFALPLAWFAWRRAVPPGYGPRLVALLALGGLQGAIGWWMVASGLIDRPDVSHVRLAVHLLAAFFIFSGLIWTALDLIQLARDRTARPAALNWRTIGVLVLLAVQLKLGAFTAGLNAGHAFAEWPAMGGRLFPANVAFLTPFWHNFVDNPIVVQFTHRWLAWLVAAAALALAARVWRMGGRAPALAIGIAIPTQIALGVATLLSGVDIAIAATHQAVAALLLAAIVWGAHHDGRRA
jgi:cytochrome c oxidase assembly protein subunit 15